MKHDDYSSEHVWALCRLTEAWLAHWDAIWPVLQAMEEADDGERTRASAQEGKA